MAKKKCKGSRVGFGLKIASSFIAAAIFLGSLIMRSIRKQDWEERSSKARRRKYFMNE